MFTPACCRRSCTWGAFIWPSQTAELRPYPVDGIVPCPSSALTVTFTVAGAVPVAAVPAVAAAAALAAGAPASTGPAARASAPTASDRQASGPRRADSR